MDDFEWATREYEAVGYVLIAFMLDIDCYHWKAIYVKTEQLKETIQKGIIGRLEKPRGV
ncbi:MAG: hypothetical protein ACUVT9_04230 [Candidatus Bathycorpusculaceae bacterium]